MEMGQNKFSAAKDGGNENCKIARYIDSITNFIHFSLVPNTL